MLKKQVEFKKIGEALKLAADLLAKLQSQDTDPAEVTRPKWVRLSLHCAQTGETSDIVHARRKRHQWHDGIQCRIGPDGQLYVNPLEYEKWVEGKSPVLNALAA